MGLSMFVCLSVAVFPAGAGNLHDRMLLLSNNGNQGFALLRNNYTGGPIVGNLVAQQWEERSLLEHTVSQ
jgi:hypothetical protein